MNNLQFTIYKKFKLILFIVYCLLLMAPIGASAQLLPGSLIVCDGVDVPCTYAKLIELARVVMRALVYISTFLATVVFAYAGYLLLTSGGNTSALEKAKGMFWKVLIGYLWILAAWLIVYTITTALLDPGYSLLK